MMTFTLTAVKRFRNSAHWIFERFSETRDRMLRVVNKMIL